MNDVVTLYFIDREQFTIREVQCPSDFVFGRTKDSNSRVINPKTHFADFSSAQMELTFLAAEYVKSVKKEKDTLKEKLELLDSYLVKPMGFLDSLVREKE